VEAHTSKTLMAPEASVPAVEAPRAAPASEAQMLQVTPGTSLSSSFRFAGAPVAAPAIRGTAVRALPGSTSESGKDAPDVDAVTGGNAGSFSIGHRVILYPDTQLA
jgi:hypothetical protein